MASRLSHSSSTSKNKKVEETNNKQDNKPKETKSSKSTNIFDLEDKIALPNSVNVYQRKKSGTPPKKIQIAKPNKKEQTDQRTNKKDSDIGKETLLKKRTNPVAEKNPNKKRKIHNEGATSQDKTQRQKSPPKKKRDEPTKTIEINPQQLPTQSNGATKKTKKSEKSENSEKRKKQAKKKKTPNFRGADDEDDLWRRKGDEEENPEIISKKIIKKRKDTKARLEAEPNDPKPTNNSSRKSTLEDDSSDSKNKKKNSSKSTSKPRSSLSESDSTSTSKQTPTRKDTKPASSINSAKKQSAAKKDDSSSSADSRKDKKLKKSNTKSTQPKSNSLQVKGLKPLNISPPKGNQPQAHSPRTPESTFPSPTLPVLGKNHSSSSHSNDLPSSTPPSSLSNVPSSTSSLPSDSSKKPEKGTIKDKDGSMDDQTLYSVLNLEEDSELQDSAKMKDNTASASSVIEDSDQQADTTKNPPPASDLQTDSSMDDGNTPQHPDDTPSKLETSDEPGSDRGNNEVVTRETPDKDAKTAEKSEKHAKTKSRQKEKSAKRTRDISVDLKQTLLDTTEVPMDTEDSDSSSLDRVTNNKKVMKQLTKIMPTSPNLPTMDDILSEEMLSEEIEKKLEISKQLLANSKDSFQSVPRDFEFSEIDLYSVFGFSKDGKKIRRSTRKKSESTRKSTSNKPRGRSRGRKTTKPDPLRTSGGGTSNKKKKKEDSEDEEYESSQYALLPAVQETHEEEDQEVEEVEEEEEEFNEDLDDETTTDSNEQSEQKPEKHMEETSTDITELNSESKSQEAAKPENKRKIFHMVNRNVYVDVKRKKFDPFSFAQCNCTYDSVKGYGCGSACLNRLASEECLPQTCPCGEHCSNQRFARYKGLNKLSRVRTPKKGYGIVAKENINANDLVVEYIGEMISTNEVYNRLDNAKDQRHFYIITLGGGQFIDASRKGNIARYINHSCNPNCRPEIWLVKGEKRVGIFAIRDIKAGEEVTFDYQFKRMGGKHQKCYCGEKNCRGYLGEKPPPARPSPKAKHKKEEKPNSEIYVDQKDILEDDITLSQYCDYILDFDLDNIPDEKVIKKRKIFLCRNIRHTQDVWKEFYVDKTNN